TGHARDQRRQRKRSSTIRERRRGSRIGPEAENPALLGAPAAAVAGSAGIASFLLGHACRATEKRGRGISDDSGIPKNRAATDRSVGGARRLLRRPDSGRQEFHATADSKNGSTRESFQRRFGETVRIVKGALRHARNSRADRNKFRIARRGAGEGERK